MGTLRNTFTTVVPLIVALTVLLSYQYFESAWTPPTSTATSGNVPAPVNEGTGDQVKKGGLGVKNLSATSIVAAGNVEIRETGGELRNARKTAYVRFATSSFSIYPDELHLGASDGMHLKTNQPYSYIWVETEGNGSHLYLEATGNDSDVEIASADGTISLQAKTIEVCDEDGKKCKNIYP